MDFMEQENIWQTSQPPVYRTEKHLPCVLLLDTSASMEGPPIQALNAGIKAFIKKAVNFSQAERSVEVAIVTFHSSAIRLVDYVPITELNIPTLEAYGAPAMGAGIELALDMIQERKDLYKKFGIPYYRPWIFMITHRAFCPESDNWRAAAARLKGEYDQKKVRFFPIGISDCNKDILKTISPDGRIFELANLDFTGLFEWIISMLVQSSSAIPAARPEDQLVLPPFPNTVSIET